MCCGPNECTLVCLCLGLCLCLCVHEHVQVSLYSSTFSPSSTHLPLPPSQVYVLL
jgi:hypothetical protein